ncbi:MAG TPA: acyl-CoA dehydrogenase family protein [Candidatus Binatia bacterium]|nr:acyl-CoA dehydrogenase family protein [Candidatus Binatia bacterium]
MAILPVPQAANDIVTATQALAPLIQKSLSAIEAERRLPLQIVDALRELGAFRMAVPHAYGGLELDPMTQVRVVEELSRMDGSVGWCAMISSAGVLPARSWRPRSPNGCVALAISPLPVRSCQWGVRSS